MICPTCNKVLVNPQLTNLMDFYECPGHHCTTIWFRSETDRSITGYVGHLKDNFILTAAYSTVTDQQGYVSLYKNTLVVAQLNMFIVPTITDDMIRLDLIAAKLLNLKAFT